MSGYRNLHREQIESTAIWNVATSPLLLTKASQSPSNAYRIFTASADGLLRSYFVREKGMEEKQQDANAVLDASALSMTCSHVLLGASQTYTESKEAAVTTALGCTQVSVARNYVGDDQAAGDLVVASLEMSGIVRGWVLPENADAELSENSAPTQTIRASHEFQVENATGTVMMLCPPRNWTAASGADLTVAVGCLDGTIALVAIAILTPQRVDSNSSPAKEASPAGTVLDRLGSRGSSIPLSITSHPSASVLAVGRSDGQVDILASSNTSQHQQQYRRHRLELPGFDAHQNGGSAVRALTYTPDGALLCAGNDGGMLAVWDVSRPGNAPPTLVHHVVQAHGSWVLDVVPLPDSRRWVTCGADQKLHVWKVDQMYQPVHTFESDHTVWTLAVRESGGESSIEKNKTTTRLAAGTETGWLQILSLDR